MRAAPVAEAYWSEFPGPQTSAVNARLESAVRRRYPVCVALPETIPVKYTEEEAEYLSVRPVVRQTFRLDELLDMLLSITGKDVPRLQQILRAGTVVFNFYRYWWPGFEAGSEELCAALDRFPDADPSRPFRAADCSSLLVESESTPGRNALPLTRETASARRWLRSRSFWDSLMALAEASTPTYQGYSYASRADLYRLDLSRQQSELLSREAVRLAPRALRARLKPLARATRLTFLCPRKP